MSHLSRLIVPISLALAFATTTAQADDRAVVEAFYSTLLSDANAKDLGIRVRELVIEDWDTIPAPNAARGGKGAEGFTKRLQFFGSIIPDLKWVPQEILQIGNRYVVRSIATGNPTGKMFGIDPKAGFEIMSIDIHEVVGGKIVKTFHVEDWQRAMEQISGNKP